MIVTESRNGSYINFVSLLSKTTEFLNRDAKKKENYYKEKSGTKLEDEVFTILNRFAINTEFNGKIELISGLNFPDIVIKDIYGLEVKSSQGTNWETTGNSIIENNRVPNISKIFLLFGKLSSPVEFICKLYEDCLSDIRVTHSPRYQIDMFLKPEDTIFAKMGISYDDFRDLKHPIDEVKKYYSSKTKEGEYLWWIDQNISVPITVKILNTFPSEQRISYILTGLILFPELFGINNLTKYYNFTSYLLNNFGIICHNVRDLFTAGGTFSYKSKQNKFFKRVPRIFKLIADNTSEFKRILYLNRQIISKNVEISEGELIKLWIESVYNFSNSFYKKSKDLLSDILT
jgi:hypothetical protein